MSTDGMPHVPTDRERALLQLLAAKLCLYVPDSHSALYRVAPGSTREAVTTLTPRVFDRLRTLGWIELRADHCWGITSAGRARLEVSARVAAFVESLA
jgi:hypothetical protein